MIMQFDHLLLAAGATKGLLLLLLPQMMQNRDFEKWLEDVKVTYKEEDHDIKYIYNEFDRVVKKLRADFSERSPILNKEGESLTPLEVVDLVNSYKLRLEKLKIMTERNIIITHNLHKPTGIKYIVARAYWVEIPGGKKFRNFSKNIGAEDKIMINGIIPPFRIKEAKDAITMMMWEQYKIEYPD
jgi:hypothetical protein